MEFQVTYITPDIKLSCYEDRLFKTEVLFEHHMLIWFISGETKIIRPEAAYVFGPGDIFLIPRNQPVTVINYPKDGLPHRSVAMHLSENRLRSFYAAADVRPALQVPSPEIRRFGRHPLLEGCLASLIPYFEVPGPFPENIASLKINEAISILRVADPGIDEVLANFSEPGKIDLGRFMEKNFMFNMPMEKFGYLSGRSLSTFNRDFRKLFGTAPGRWLTRKRLELAHYQLSELKKKPVDVYLEVGFEDLSHFSYAFKKQFGYPPAVLSEC